jgi:hypothetical protein
MEAPEEGGPQLGAVAGDQGGTGNVRNIIGTQEICFRVFIAVVPILGEHHERRSEAPRVAPRDDFFGVPFGGELGGGVRGGLLRKVKYLVVGGRRREGAGGMEAGELCHAGSIVGVVDQNTVGGLDVSMYHFADRVRTGRRNEE